MLPEFGTEQKLFLSVKISESKSLKVLTSWLVIFAVLISGCAQYKRPPIMIKVPSFYDNSVSFKQLTLIADPYIERGKTEHLFNTNLIEKKFLPVHFIAFNDGDKAFNLSRADVTLVRDDGVVFSPVAPEQVSKKVLRRTSLRMLGWGFAGLIVLSVPLSLAAGVDSRRANQGIRRTLKENVLKSHEIGANEIVTGFYFFKIGKSSGPGTGSLTHQYRFKMERLLEVDSGAEYEFNIGIN